MSACCLDNMMGVSMGDMERGIEVSAPTPVSDFSDIGKKIDALCSIIPKKYVMFEKILKWDVDYWMNVDNYNFSDYELQLLSSMAESTEKLCPEWKHNYMVNSAFLDSNNILLKYYGNFGIAKCLVVGAGRTAIDNIEHIKKAAQNGWAIVAVDRIHSFLKKNGITPDLTVTADRQEIVKNFFDSLDEYDVVAADICQHPEVIKKIKSKNANLFFYAPTSSVACDSRWIYEHGNKDLLCAKCGATVGYTAVEIAYWMLSTMFRSITIIGMELGWFSFEDVDIKLEYGLFDDNISDEEKEVRGGHHNAILKTKLRDGRDFYSIRGFITCEMCMRDLFGLYSGVLNAIDCSGGLLRNCKKITLEKLLQESVK